MKNPSRYAALLATALTLCLATASLADAPPRNVLLNGSFDRVVSGQPEAWKLLSGESQPTNATLVVDQGRDGHKALKLEFPGSALRPDSTGSRVASSAAFEQSGIPLNVSDPYTLSFWMRGEDVYGRSVKVTLYDDSEHEYAAIDQPLYATSAWQHYEFNFQWWLNKAPGTTRLRFTLSEPGTVWVSDAAITCTPPVTPHYNPRLPVTAGKNFLPNGSFELGRDGWSMMGSKTGWGGDVSGFWGEVSAQGPFEGAHSLKIDLGPGKSPVTFADGWPPARVVQNALLAASLGWIDVKPGQDYTLSVYMKANRPGVAGRLLIRQGRNPLKGGILETPKNVTLSEKWERYSLTVKAEADQICVAAGPDISATPDAPASAWIDGVQLEAGAQPTAYAPSEPLGVGLELTPSGHVIAPEKSVTFQLTAANATAAAETVSLTASVRDYFGKIVAQPQLTLAVPAHARVEQPWDLGRLGRGYFTVTIAWASGAVHHQQEVRLAVLDPYPGHDSLFGINHAPSTTSTGKVLQQAGILWARDWSLNWGQLEPKPGQLSFTLSDQQLDRLKQEGFNIICLTPPLPSADWSSTAPDSVAAELWNRMGYLPKDPRLLLNFVSQAVKHSRDRVHTWEFLNEPVWTGFCLPQADFNKPGANYTPSDYINLLKQAYPVIKEADPEGRVIGGFAAQPWHFSREFVEQDGLRFVDIFNIHNYGTTRAPEVFIGEMEALQKTMDDHGGRKPIWLTEYSYYGSDQLPWEPWFPSSEEWASNLQLRDERQCADWSIRYNVIMLAHGVEKIFYHSGVMGTPNSGNLFLECAMLAEGEQPRKLFAAQGVLARMLGADCRFARPLAIEATLGGRPTEGIHGYAFQCGQRAVMPVWATEAAAKNQPWRIKIPAGARALDVMGNPLPGESIPLGVSPIYLVSESIPADQLANRSLIVASAQANPRTN